MASSTLAALTASGALAGSELFYSDSGVADVKVTATQIKTWCSASPTLVTPALGTPASGTLTSCSGLPISSGLTGAGTGALTALGTAVNTNGGFVTASTASIASGALLTGGGSGTEISAITPGTGVATALASAVNGTGGLITYAAFAPASAKVLTLSNTLTLAGTDSTTMTFPPASASIGYINIPQVGGAAKTTSYTGVLADQGQMAVMNATTLTYTIPANASVAYPVGTVLTIVNIFAGNLSIAITTDTLTLAGSTTTGTRTLAQNGIATALKVTSTSWIINGTGLT